MTKKHNTQGFTLIELLVVIAIIGILASVVLASVNSARQRGRNASVNQTLAGLRAQIQVVFEDRGGRHGNAYVSPAGAQCPAISNTSSYTTASSGTGSTAHSFFDPRIKAILEDVAIKAGGAVTGTGTTAYLTRTYCRSNATIDSWAVAVTLPDDSGAWCVDSSGVSKLGAVPSDLASPSSVIGTTGSTIRCN